MLADSAKIDVLLLEDDDLDAALLETRLADEELPVTLRRARTKAEYLSELNRGGIDVILSDFSLPGYGGLEALDAAQAIAAEVPFIFVSGAIGEDRAAETLKRGAMDYVLKDRPQRLVPAVLRALRLTAERQLRLQAEAERDRLLASERAARASAEAANRMKDEFLAVVSHELRTPLNAILGWASVLSGRVPDEDPLLAKAVRTIERNARMQARLIEDLLDISRIITGKLQIRADEVSVAGFVNAAVEAVSPAAEAKDITLSVTVASSVTVIGDADRLQQIVWNLLSNAIKFTPQSGSVTLVAAQQGDAVTVEVRDTGAGIAPEFLPYVFERFRQEDATVTRTQGGLGLGLAIVRQLAELHGGTVSAESEGPGHGARFQLQLPVRRSVPQELSPESRIPESISSESSPAPPVTISLNGVQVLLVEDQADAREVVALILRGCGARVRSVGSVAEALSALQDTSFDVIVSDIGMPNTDGYTFLRQVRELPRENVANTPAIAVTAFASKQDAANAAAAGFQRHVAKPVSAQQLVLAVAEVLQAPPAMA